MTVFAHIESGVCRDVKDNTDQTEYLKRWPTSVTENWQVVECPDGTQEYADAQTFQNPQSQSPPAKPEFITLDGSTFISVTAGAIGMARLDQLLAKSETVKALLLKAEKVDRNSGNTPMAITYLKTGTNALTDDELALIDAAWRAKV